MAEGKHHWSYHLTTLSNERTLLAYIRTSLTMFVAGISFVEFFANPFVIKIGLVFIVFGVIIFFVGLVRFWKIKKLIIDDRE